MMNEQKLVPELRFPEFIEGWNPSKLGSIARFSKGKGISKADIKEDGNQPCIRYGELYTTYNELIDDVVSYTDIDQGELVLSEENDVIIPASGESNIDIATAACVRNAEIALGSDLNIIKTKLDGVFLSYYLNSHLKYKVASYAQGNSVVHLYSTQLKLLDLNVPSFDEQQKIASFLTAVDQRIALLEKKKALLEQYKKGVMQKIFPSTGSGQVPEIRFKDENGNDFEAWEENKLGEVTKKVSRKNKEGIKYPVYSINNEIGFLPQSEQFDGLDSNSRGFDISMYKIVESQTFAYNPARINVGSIGYSYNLGSVIISSLYVCFKTTTELEDIYLLQVLETSRFKFDITRFEEGGVRQYLFYDNFSKIKIPIPSLEEQNHISSFIEVINRRLKTLSRLIETNISFKKGLLQKMFV